MLISEIYRQNPKTFPATGSVKEAVEDMVKNKLNALVVLDHKKRVIGVLALQDVAAATVPSQFRKNIRMAAAMYKTGFFTEMCQQLKDQPVTEVMRKEFISVDLHDNIMAVTADFLKNDLYLVPVLDKNKQLLGVVTRSEIKRALLYGMRELPTSP